MFCILEYLTELVINTTNDFLQYTFVVLDNVRSKKGHVWNASPFTPILILILKLLLRK